MHLIRDIRLTESNVFGMSTLPNWGRADHGYATEHCNHTEVDTHGPVEVVCRIVKGSLAIERRGRNGHLREAREDIGKAVFKSATWKLSRLDRSSVEGWAIVNLAVLI